MQLDEVGIHPPLKPPSLHFEVKDDGQKAASSEQQGAGGQILQISDRHQVVCRNSKILLSTFFMQHNIAKPGLSY